MTNMIKISIDEGCPYEHIPTSFAKDQTSEIQVSEKKYLEYRDIERRDEEMNKEYRIMQNELLDMLEEHRKLKKAEKQHKRDETAYRRLKKKFESNSTTQRSKL